ncbi:MAG TPA: glycosyltransferase family 2 protein [Blastocatellia bacterium]|nr:glycosyltransferase family 2 protein [Blastocatellia bacterium]
MSTAVESIENLENVCAKSQTFRAGVVIVSYNAKQKLMTCLASLRQALPADCDLVVVDNASAEGNADAIAAAFPDVKLIRSAVNLGFAAGCNLGARHTRSRSLVFLNPDTVVEPGWIEALIKPLEADDRTGLTTARILLMSDPERLNTCGCNIHLSGLTLCRGMARGRDTYLQREPVGAISGAAFAIRAELFERLGGFDEEMFLYLEDTDLSWRARLNGWQTVYTPDSLVLHDYELRITPLKVFWEERNRYLMLIKSLRWPTLLLLTPAYAVAEFITWTFVLLKDRHNTGNKLRAYGWMLRNWRLIMSKRRATQLLRRVSDREMLKGTGFAIDFGQASGGFDAAVARLVFNPLFFVMRAVLLAVVWW